MVDQTALRNEWIERLANYHERLACDQSNHNWLAKIYVKVLSYLVSAYRDVEWKQDAQNPPPEAPLPIDVDHRFTSDLPEIERDGRPARSATSIRHTLNAVHDANLDNMAHQMPKGSHVGNRLVAMTFRSRDVARRFHSTLKAKGLGAALKRTGEWYTLTVPRDDYPNARKILVERDAYLVDQEARRRGADPFNEVGDRIFLVLLLSSSIFLILSSLVFFN